MGLYASVPAILVYALRGTCRRLIMNPEAVTCAMIGAGLAPRAVRLPVPSKARRGVKQTKS